METILKNRKLFDYLDQMKDNLHNVKNKLRIKAEIFQRLVHFQTKRS